MVETSRQITPNRKERIEEIEGVAKTGKTPLLTGTSSLRS